MSARAAKSQTINGSGRRICIVTPGQIGSNPRVVKEADALHAAGYDVSVVAIKAMDIVEPRDRALMQRIPWALRRVDLGSRWEWRTRRAVQIAARCFYRVAGHSAIADQAFSAYTNALMGTVLEVSADLYIAHYPSALPAAAAAARRYGARLAYDAEDFHLGQSPEELAYDEERALLRAVEGRYLPLCSYVTAASPGIADALVGAYGIEAPWVVLNVFPLDQALAAPTPRGNTEPGPSIYWFSQTIGPNRGLECAIRAIGLAETKPHLYLRGTPTQDFAKQLRVFAASVGADGRIHLLPPGAPDEMVRLAARYDLGLCSEPGHTLNNRIALTNKLFTYWLAGVPPLMSDIPAQKSFAEAAGFSDLIYTRGDPTAFAEMLDRLLENRDRLVSLRARVWNSAQQRWNWDVESSTLLQAVHGAISPIQVQPRSPVEN